MTTLPYDYARCTGTDRPECQDCLSAFVSEVRKLHQDGMKEALRKKILDL